MKKWIEKKEVVTLLILLGLCAVITCMNPSFLRVDNLISILKSNLVVGTIAIGMLVVMITGGIDLSVGASLSAICYIVAYFLVNVSDNILLALLVAMASGFVIGFINYLVIAKLNVPAMVATLGTMSIISGVLLYVTEGNRINVMPETMVEFSNFTFFKFNINDRAVGIPIQALFFVLVCIVTWIVLKHTRTGRGVYAIGGNLEFAKRVGYNSDRILMFAYSFLGVLVGVAAFISVSIYKQVDPAAYNGFEFSVVAVVILGGASISGGFGSVLGTVLGVLLMGVIENGLVLAFVPTYWQEIIVGIIILIAIVINALQEERRKKNIIKVDV